MVRGGAISGKSVVVHAGCHVRVGLGIAAPPRAVLVAQHLNNGRLIACERIPIAAGRKYIDLKTHPDATHLDFAVEAAGRSVDHASLTVDCGNPIVPVARHFIVIGAMKAGTTSVFRSLEGHPEICRTWAEVPGRSFTKEINYFNALYQQDHSPLHYDWRFPFVEGKQSWTLDVSPNYAKLWASKPVPARIASLGGSIKLAYILRDPIDRVESHIAHTLREGGEVKNLNHCIRISRYAQHLDRFIRHFPRDDILLLDFEQLGRDPATVQTALCDFLGIERRVSKVGIHNKRSVQFRLTSAQRAEIAKAVERDVGRLISEYGFKPAETWLRKPPSPRFRFPALRI